jgi:polysaccharide pyruvyl transferase WcaK-like protein
MNDLNDVMAEIAGCDMVLGSRFHVLIAGLNLGRPCISLNYGPKHQLLMDAAGVGAFCQDADNFDYDLLVRHFETLAADTPRYQAIVQERVAGMRERLAAAEHDIFTAVIAR